MDASEIYHFLFETYAGMGILVGAGIVISIVLCVIFEFRTRKLYRNHEVNEEDEWAIFEDNLEKGIEEAEAAEGK